MVIEANHPDIDARKSFAASLLDIAWWDWPAEKITANIPAIVGGDADLLGRF